MPTQPLRRSASRRTRDSDLTGLAGIIYGRKSTLDRRNPGKSTTDQVAILSEEFDRRGVVTHSVLVDEAKGASVYSKAKVRDAFERIMFLIATEDIAVIGFWEQSRSTRRLAVHGQLMELCAERNVLILLENRLLDPADADDSFQLGIGAVMSEVESARISHRSRRGTKAAALAGRPHGVCPYGYERTYHPRTRALLGVEVVPHEAEIVRWLAERVLAGDSSRSLAVTLNERGEPRPYGGLWSAAEVKDTLTRPTYTGRRTHYGEDVAEGIWPAILDQETHEALLAIYRERAMRRGTHAVNAKYLLTGVVFCGRCANERMYVGRSRALRPGETEDQVLAYICKKCRLSRRKTHLEAWATATIDALLSDHDALRMFLGGEQDPEVERMTKALDDARRELAVAEFDLAEGDISAKAFTITEKRLSKTIESLSEEIGNRQTRSNTFSTLAGSGIRSLNDLETIEAKRAIIQTAFRIVVHMTGRKGPKGFNPNAVEMLPAF